MKLLRYTQLILFTLASLLSAVLMAQPRPALPTAENDTLVDTTITFSPESASVYIMHLIGMEKLWRNDNDTLKLSLSRLIDQFSEPFDSVRTRLARYPFEPYETLPANIVSYDTLPLRWLSESIFIIDTVALEKEPYTVQRTIVYQVFDSIAEKLASEIPDIQQLLDSLLQKRDTITEVYIDSRYLASKQIQMHRISDDGIYPPLLPPQSRKTYWLTEDSASIIISESKRVLIADQPSPFYIVHGPHISDSLRLAVETLLWYTYERDSVVLYFHDIEGRKMPFWLTSGKDDHIRYWVKNAEKDSITIWIGNPSKYDLSLSLEEGIQIERLEKKTADDIPITTAQPVRVLATVTPLQEIPVYWNFSFASSFALNQNYLSNWARGGESSMSGMLDINSRARYTDRANKVEWTSSGRLRYGTIRTKERGFRTSTDMVELNSQYNKKIRDKLDFSSILYMKTQVAEGFKYPNDSVVVSKFLNPGTFTVGVGIEYEPFKDTKLNFSVLSYRNTFVLDTANINQNTHGIDRDKRARQEMGGQLVIRNRMTILDGLSITNAIRLFSNYLDKPQNVDVDWEMSLNKQINWYFSIRLNLHLIYDDDIRFPVLDSTGQPVFLPDGSPRRAPAPQFNQFLGITMSFRI